MMLAGLFWVATFFLAGAGIVGSWGPGTELDFLCGVSVAAPFTAVLSVAAVLGYIMAPLAASYGIGVRAALRAGRDMPPPHGRHARELATDPYENVVRLRPLASPAVNARQSPKESP
jgi:hypothetical protein